MCGKETHAQRVFGGDLRSSRVRGQETRAQRGFFGFRISDFGFRHFVCPSLTLRVREGFNARQRAGIAAELQPRLVDVVAIEVCIAEGVDELERARKGLFGEPLVDLAKIYLYKDEGKWAKGIELTRKLRRSYPSSKLLVQHEGYFLFRLGKFDAAIKEFDNVLASDPKNGPVHLYKGAALFRLKRLKLAEKECRACINLPSTPFYKAYAYYFLGKIALDRGDDALAEKYWKEALRIYPGSKKAKIALLMLQRKRVLKKR